MKVDPTEGQGSHPERDSSAAHTHRLSSPGSHRPARMLRALVARLEGWTGVGLAGQALLLAVGAAVVSVSLGQLQALAVHSNERDAVRLLERLGERVAQTHAERGAVVAAGVGLGALGNLGEGLGAAASIQRYGDMEWLDEGRRLRRRGYGFTLIEGESGEPLLVAWPWQHGRTGLAAFAHRPAVEGAKRSAVIGHPNRDGALSGPDLPPLELWAHDGWRRVRL